MMDLLRGFPHNIHPFLGSSSHLTPYLGNIMVTNIPFLSFSSGSGNMCTYFTITLGGPTTDIQYNKGPTPLFSGGHWRLWKHVRINYPPFFLIFSGSFWKIPHISGDWFKNTPYSGFSQENLPETNSKKIPPFPKKMGKRMRPPCPLEWGAGIYQWPAMHYREKVSLFIYITVWAFRMTLITRVSH